MGQGRSEPSSSFARFTKGQYVLLNSTRMFGCCNFWSTNDASCADALIVAAACAASSAPEIRITLVAVCAPGATEACAGALGITDGTGTCGDATGMYGRAVGTWLYIVGDITGGATAKPGASAAETLGAACVYTGTEAGTAVETNCPCGL
eukprot:CAMPEP_0180510690 /NCGR_PEP_ID=MMETSP1036_2-20121128/50519_1 /TAXON_ID=632150 /ORGANISM="Azadinium spinosum, Strain 3D9" /LENGTH=149 /DNA_ID=CAMNT_0022521439 /DNA_START=144 /DNA_END=593 /DNA_ORIENTATION=-